ncbi:histidine kinase [Myxococcus xanthus]|uniref:Response regulator n=2 Tax=Myxococcus xanthus TaxID=34 RepID=A0A4Y6CGM0_MYXXA|nr:response regulator [Myxococcus xanthus]NOJ90399.1 response regulator [Myxococcus xanthus]QDE92650.1 histidine kinase [Myxococcus xanthus]
MASKNFLSSLVGRQPRAFGQPHRSHPAGENMLTFLFVDEDPRSLAALRRLVRDLPGGKRFARCVAEALALVKEEAPSVVVTGDLLPDGDGLGLLEQVRASHPRTACALHAVMPPLARDITWMDRAAPPSEVHALLRMLGIGAASMGRPR